MATRVQTVDDICLAARDAARELAAVDGATRAAALHAMADAIDAQRGPRSWRPTSATWRPAARRA